MDKFEYQAKLEEIGRLVEAGDYEEAAKIADSIEWKRVRSVRTLCMVSEIYEEVGRVEDSKAILSRAYRRSPNSRQILYRLTEVCVLTEEFDDAVEYYTEYVNLSPNDNNRFILKYEIYKGRGSSVEEQIKVLEDLKAAEYTERWAYELACLYEQAGMIDKCVTECNDLALWFHSGKFVVKALELKQKYEPLTREQQTIYDNPSEIVDMETKEAVIEKAVPTLDEEIMKDLPASEAEAIADSILMDTEREIAASIAEHRASEGKNPEEIMEKEESSPSITEIAEMTEAMEEAAAMETKEEEEQTVSDGSAGEEAERDTKTEKLDPRRFDTVNLQKELANSMKEILSGITPAKKEDEEAGENFALEEILEVPEVLEEKKEEKKAEEKAEEKEELPNTEVKNEEQTDDREEQVTETEEEAKAKKEKDVLLAATIDLGERLKREIGEIGLREYAVLKDRDKKFAAKANTDKQKKEAPVPEKQKTVENANMSAKRDEAADGGKSPILEMPETPVIKPAPAIKEVEEVVMPETVKEKEEASAETEITEVTMASAEEFPISEELPEVSDIVDAALEEMLKNERRMEEIARDQDENSDVTEKNEPENETEESEEQTPAIDPMSYTKDELDDKEKSMLGFWSTIEGINEQVNDTVVQIMRSSLADKTSATGNVVLVGDAGNGRTTLAIAIAKIVCRCKGLQRAKVAKIYAEDLNNKDLAQVIEKMAGGVLIIEEAGDMSDGTIGRLSAVMELGTDSLTIFLEDERRYLQELLARNPKFAQKFDITVNVPMLTNDELVEFGKMYALQNDCVLSDSAILALYDDIGALQTPEQPVAILDVKELLDKAMRRAKAFGIGKVFSTLSGKRYNSDNRVIVKGNAFKKIK